MPEVWDEASCDRVSGGDDVRLPNAPRRYERCTGSVPEVRHEARAELISCQKAERSTDTSTTKTGMSMDTSITKASMSKTPRKGSSGKTTWSRSTEITTPANMRWKLVDRSTGAENAAIDWRFRVGDQVKIRLVNEMDSDHPMPHPFHIHGAGRFLILARDDVPEQNLVWKDTVLVRTGETVDILLDVTNPGLWMAHCHIAEHHESGMMFSFHVDDAL